MLPDYLGPDLRIVFCGTAASEQSARRGHYYSGPGNLFWTYLHEADLTPVQLQPEDDQRVLEFGMGLTDLAKKVSASQDSAELREHYDVPAFLAKIEAMFLAGWHSSARKQPTPCVAIPAKAAAQSWGSRPGSSVAHRSSSFRAPAGPIVIPVGSKVAQAVCPGTASWRLWPLPRRGPSVDGALADHRP